MLKIKVRFVPAEPSQNEKAPDLRVLAGNNVEIGAAWKRTSVHPCSDHASSRLRDSYYSNRFEVMMVPL